MRSIVELIQEKLKVSTNLKHNQHPVTVKFVDFLAWYTGESADDIRDGMDIEFYEEFIQYDLCLSDGTPVFSSDTHIGEIEEFVNDHLDTEIGVEVEDRNQYYMNVLYFPDETYNMESNNMDSGEDNFITYAKDNNLVI